MIKNLVFCFVMVSVAQANSTPTLVEQSLREVRKKVLKEVTGYSGSSLEEYQKLLDANPNYVSEMHIKIDLMNLPSELREKLREDKIIQIAASRFHILFLTEEGRVFSFGLGDDGQLGHGDLNHRKVPKSINLLTTAGDSVVQVAAGSFHSLILTRAGQLYSFGGGAYGQLGHGDRERSLTLKRVTSEALDHERIVQIAAGRSHSLLLTESGHIFSFGMGASGQLGHGDTTDQLSPKRVISESLEVERVVQIAAGDCHSLLLTESGQVFTFGSGSEGQLGHGDKMNYLSPTKINSQTLENQQIIQVAAGQMHTLLLNAEGHVFTFGNGFFGQLGHGKNESVLSPKVLSWETLSDRRIVQVSAGATHSLLLTQEGEVLTFGQGETLQIGNVNVDVQARPKSIPSKALEGQRVIQVSSGHTFSLLLTEKGELLLLGTGDDEQFSQDETPDSGSIPRPVKKGWFWLPEDFGLFSEDKKVQRDT